MKLTPARAKALRFFQQHDGSKFFPVGISTRTLTALLNEGLLRVESPPFGYVRHFITDAGRAALEATP